jgi:hypothetical protein
MSAQFHSFFDIQPASQIANPEPTYQKSSDKAPYHVGILPDVELESFAINKDGHGCQSSTSKQSSHNGTQTPKTPTELEDSRPATPSHDDGFARERTWNADPMTKWRILCCCLIYFSNGMNDAGE